MQVQKPKLTRKILSLDSLQTIINQGCDDEETQINFYFEKDTLEYGKYQRLDLRDTHLVNCYFDEVTINHSYLTDILFENCDLSNLNLSNTLLRRVHFKNCKMTGTHFSECIFDSVYFDNTLCNLAGFGDTTIKQLSVFENSNLSESSFINNDLKKVDFKQCNLTGCEFLYSSLKDKDLTDSNIDHISIRLEDLRGAIVNSYQALNLSSLLGIKIKD